MISMGLDLSFRGTGVVVKDGPQLLAHARLSTEARKEGQDRYSPSGKFRGTDDECIEHIRKRVRDLLKEHHPVAVGIENHQFGRGNNASTQIHEVQGVIKNFLFRKKVLYMPVAISTLKKHATGNGRASKEDMVLATQSVWPECPNDDEADAYWLADYAEVRYSDLVETE